MAELIALGKDALYCFVNAVVQILSSSYKEEIQYTLSGYIFIKTEI